MALDLGKNVGKNLFLIWSIISALNFINIDFPDNAMCTVEQKDHSDQFCLKKPTILSNIHQIDTIRCVSIDLLILWVLFLVCTDRWDGKAEKRHSPMNISRKRQSIGGKLPCRELWPRPPLPAYLKGQKKAKIFVHNLTLVENQRWKDGLATGHLNFTGSAKYNLWESWANFGIIQ